LHDDATRCRFLGAAAAVAGVPRPLGAQAKTVKIGVVHPVTGPLAEPGQACRMGAQMAADAINATGGLKAARPDVIAPITRPPSAQVLLPAIRKQRVAVESG
jgi:Periplasmic binding protein